MSSSIYRTAGSTTAVGDSFGLYPDQRSGAGRCGASRRSTRRRISRSAAPLREVLIDGVSLGARARHAVPALLLYHRRRAAAEGAGARRRRGSRRRRGHARRARRDREIPRRAARSRRRSSRRSSRCSRGSTRSRPRPRSHPAAWRSRVDAVRYDIDGRTRLGVASTFLAGRVSPATRSRSTCRRPRLRAARRSRDADHHGRPRHRHRAVPRLPPRAHGDRRPAATGCSSATSAATTISSTRTSSPA